MLKICSFLQKLRSAFAFVDKLTKNVYRTCAVIASAGIVVAVVSFMAVGFGGAGKNNVKVAAAERIENAALDDEEIENTNEMGLQVGLIDGLLFSENENEQISQISQLGKVIYDVFSSTGNKLITIGEIKLPEPEVTVQDNTNDVLAGTIVNTSIEFTQEDYMYLVRIVESEAGICDMKGRILVANVILNRVRSKKFPNTIKAVITQNESGIYQFTPVQTGQIYTINVKQSTIEAVDRALAGEDYSNGALYFCSTASYNRGNWMRWHLKELFSHDGHIFFK
ncbi:MAG: cell wall hydrolase [Lachnospira sp.]|nr:cell wall hydrolase [Lachnospira sp.]